MKVHKNVRQRITARHAAAIRSHAVLIERMESRLDSCLMSIVDRSISAMRTFIPDNFSILLRTLKERGAITATVNYKSSVRTRQARKNRDARVTSRCIAIKITPDDIHARRLEIEANLDLKSLADLPCASSRAARIQHAWGNPRRASTWIRLGARFYLRHAAGVVDRQ